MTIQTHRSAVGPGVVLSQGGDEKGTTRLLLVGGSLLGRVWVQILLPVENGDLFYVHKYIVPSRSWWGDGVSRATGTEKHASDLICKSK